VQGEVLFEDLDDNDNQLDDMLITDYDDVDCEVVTLTTLLL